MSRGLDVGFLGSVDPQRGGAGSAAARPVLIARRYFYASTTDTVPSRATRAVMKCVGVGGGPYVSSGVYKGGGGGAFARTETSCQAGQTATVSVPPISGSDGPDVSIVLNGVTNLAAGGKGNTGGFALGGADTDCIGTVRRSGGFNGAAGQNGGAGGGNGGLGGSVGGGGSAGDIGDPDAAGFGGVGGDAPGSRAPGYGGGAGISNNGFTSTGMAMIEYWSA